MIFKVNRNSGLIFLFVFNTVQLLSQSNDIFKKQCFGKGKTVVYVGSGAVKRHFEKNIIQGKPSNYFKSPSLIFGFDKCIYPYARNAYLGLGLYCIIGFRTEKEKSSSDLLTRNILNTTFALRLSHHLTYLVRKKLDVSTGYIFGAQFNYLHARVKEESSVSNSTSLLGYSPAYGISLTCRYYLKKNVGVYIESALGKNISLLNIGLNCHL